ncbi:Biotin carboxyl carrier protein of acetyl-CoA carboxylase [Sphingomonas antarctica]|uniref:acetyl-CoA carboxylase biotin carboxyl carrier protein n=1 Tax=Sphingomonas antarctica TaxID=2040274 RepID=UPI0039E75559
MSDEEGAMQVDVALVRQLAELLDETKLTEIEVEHGERRIRVARKAAAVAGYAPAPAAAPLPAPTASLPAETPTTAASESGTPVKSPMVGTVYLSAEPGSKPFASVGDKVSEGQTLVIIEAMKVMNAIPAPNGGTVKRICVENGQPVEFDQSLIIIE